MVIKLIDDPCRPHAFSPFFFIIFLVVADKDLSAVALRRQMSYSYPWIRLAMVSVHFDKVRKV
jgi:hypothetical protein